MNEIQNVINDSQKQKNPLRMFIWKQKSIEPQLLQYEIPEMSSY